MVGSATGTGNIFEFNGHYYEFIDSSTVWHDARDYATSQTYNGITGSLIRIDSAEENAFILDYAKNHVTTGDQWIFLGASDEANEGNWVWEQGNEHFWTGDTSGSSTNGQYTNFLTYFDYHPELHHYLSMWIGGDGMDPAYGTLEMLDGAWSGNRPSSSDDGFAYVIEYSAPPPPAPSRVEVWDKDGITQYFDSDGDGKFETDFNDSPYRALVLHWSLMTQSIYRVQMNLI